MKKIILMLIGILFLIVGCGTSPTYTIGKEFNVNKVSQIEPGVTTEREIISYFGIPYKRGEYNGKAVYTYTQENIYFESGDNIRSEGNTLVIEFD